MKENNGCNYIPLSDLMVGHSAQIIKIDKYISPIAFHRLEDMGIRAGAFVYCERKSIFGDPGAYRLEGSYTLIAVRRSDADHILIKESRSQKDGRYGIDT